MTISPTKPTIEDSLLPPKVMTALSMVVSGPSDEVAVKSVNITARQQENGINTKLQKIF